MRETGLSSRRNNLRICRQNKPNVNTAGAFGAEGVGVDEQQVGGVGRGREAVEVDELAGEGAGAVEQGGGSSAGRKRPTGGDRFDELAEPGPVLGGEVEAGAEVEEGFLAGASMDAHGLDEAEVGIGGAVGGATVGGAPDEHWLQTSRRGGGKSSEFAFITHFLALHILALPLQESVN